ncbi:ABC transporter substrate-binding protein [Tanticharoenia sakaeratensis]|uniref:ABC transporter dipeptide binding protein n=1 Tax=Tanticharoenia sakaeratensis NBRC 103193 TaxID=1231623 RepID=A0A0D6MKF5_9PROT|nr:ABC transporter substrate-binding protein [Tanticharoenia sakaeratensis]GAN54159.1 ABC transporter dipeptide binding protein [Tanticharoenia sakaeratensis NBRC 103193]GBQ19423.1 peptide ABC transporter substrate-binding protein [Tanticharoenia sakaeratensis NBRC 103193]
MSVLRAVAAGVLLSWTAGAWAADPASAAYDATGETRGSPHRGGTLRLTADGSAGTLDPQINYNTQYMQLFSCVYDQLVTYRKARGRDGDTIVPDLVEALPTVSPDGLTWTMRLRPNVLFSDGRTLRAQDVVASFRRIFKVGSPTAKTYYGAIAGADACLDHPGTCTLPGVEGDDATGAITIRLSRPDGEFLQKLSFPHATILPADTPTHDLGNTPAPTTGPYRIVSYDPNAGMMLDRNPHFHVFSAHAQPDGFVDAIDYRFGLSDEAQVSAVERGVFDWMLDPKPADRLGELGAEHTAQTHIERLFGMYYLSMNMHEKPFTSALVRQAVNDAVDRHVMTILAGGGAIADPLCQMVPAGLPGSDAPCFYGRDASLEHPRAAWAGPDMARARGLIARSGEAGAHITLVVSNRASELNMGVYIRNLLQSLGFVVDVRPVSEALVLSYTQNSGNHIQISLARWFADYPSASNFLDDLFGCENFVPNSDASVNSSGFCDAHAQDLMTRASLEHDPARSAALWADANAAIMRAAPAAPLIQMHLVDLVSARLGNYFYTDLYHMLFSGVWVQ